MLALLLKRIADGTVSANMAKEIFRYMWAGEGDADNIILARGFKQVSDAGIIEKMVDDVIAANPKSVEEYKAGKDKAFNALFGQVMKASNKTANPAQVTEILKAEGILGKPIGIYRIVAKTPMHQSVWRGRVQEIARELT